MKKKRKINIPAAKFGLDQLSGVMLAIPGAITTLSNPFLTSQATTGGEATAQSISDIGSGMANGAQLGMAIGGPMGGVIGGAAGAAVGLIGKKGSEAEMTSFTDYNEGTLGTGLIGAFSNKKLREERKRVANNAYGNRAAVQGTANLQSEWNETMSAEYGGIIPESLVYADDGELINTPYGDINKIPEKGRSTDSNLLSLPEGSRILSNTLKVPGTKKTFAEMGDKLINKRKSKYTDRYAENSLKLNDMNSLIAYDNLFALLEEVKRKKGIKPKTKELVQAAENGDVVNTPPLAPTLDEIDPMYMYDYEDKPLTKAPIYRDTDKPGIPTSTKSDASSGNRSFDWMGLISGIGQLAPALSNIFTSKPKAIEANYNPYSDAVLSTMRRRRYNVEPALRDIRRNRAINNYNVNQTNTSTGANLAFALQSAINSDRAIADVRAQESNINNQYLGEYANAMNDLGQQWVNATNYAEDLNRKAQANARNIRRQGLSQLSGILQNRELMSNQMNRDNAMLLLYAPFLEAGFTASDLQNMLKYIRRGGNNVG